MVSIISFLWLKRKTTVTESDKLLRDKPMCKDPFVWFDFERVNQHDKLTVQRIKTYKTIG